MKRPKHSQGALLISSMPSHSIGMGPLPLTLWERVTLATMVGTSLGAFLGGVTAFLKFVLPFFH
jgi:hypothetical protein